MKRRPAIAVAMRVTWGRTAGTKRPCATIAANGGTWPESAVASHHKQGGRAVVGVVGVASKPPNELGLQIQEKMTYQRCPFSKWENGGTEASGSYTGA